jgi:transcriptional regulator with XRE-family HTH domain
MTATQINRNVDDLHPEDNLNRLRLRDWMLEEQKRQNLNDKEIAARVGHHSSWTHKVLSTTTWRVATVQKMLRALGYTLTFNLKIDNIVVPPSATVPLTEIYANNPDVEQREEAARRDLCDYGRRYREALGLNHQQLGKRLRCEGATVLTWETGDQPFYLLVTAQRFFRALGGELKLVITKMEDNGTQRIFEAPEGRWPSTIDDLINIVQLPDRTLIWNSNKAETVVSFPADAWKAWLKAND